MRPRDNAHRVRTGAGPSRDSGSGAADTGPYCWTVTSTCGRPSPRRASRSCLSWNPSHPARRNPPRISRHPSSRFIHFPSNGVMPSSPTNPANRGSRLDGHVDLRHPVVLHAFIREVIPMMSDTPHDDILLMISMRCVVVVFVFLFLATGHEETCQQHTSNYEHAFHTPCPPWQRFISVLVSIISRTPSQYTDQRRRHCLWGVCLIGGPISPSQEGGGGVGEREEETRRGGYPPSNGSESSFSSF